MPVRSAESGDWRVAGCRGGYLTAQRGPRTRACAACQRGGGFQRRSVRGLADAMDAADVYACAGPTFAVIGGPSTLNSGQGSVPDSAASGDLESEGVCQSMDGKARQVDDVIAERRFRSLKAECPGPHERPSLLRPGCLFPGSVEQYDSARGYQPLGYETLCPWFCSNLPFAA